MIGRFRVSGLGSRLMTHIILHPHEPASKKFRAAAATQHWLLGFFAGLKIVMLVLLMFCCCSWRWYYCWYS